MTRVITTGLAAATLALLAACGPTTANEGKVSDGTGKPAEAGQTGQTGAKPANDAPTWGKRYTWSDGLALEVSQPAACKPSQAASPQNVERAVKFTITVINGTDKPFEAASFINDAQFDGRTAESVYDVGGSCGEGGLEVATILPGKSFTFDRTYAVGPNPGQMQLAFQPTLATADRAVYVGQA